MMLRSKHSNIEHVPVDNRQKRKQDSGNAIHPNEPAAKKSIGELSTDIKAFIIDSSKRATRIDKENANPVDKLPIIRKVEEAVFDPCPDYDFDKEEGHMPENVSDYANDIFKYYKSRERDFKVEDYMKKHPDLDTKTRAILVDWLVELQESFELNHETLYNAVKIVDLYLANTSNVTKDAIQMVASAAIFIASKFDERSPPLIEDLIYLAGSRFDRNAMLAMERDLFEQINFDLGAPLSYRYLRRLARVTHTEMKSLTLGRYILETSLLVYDYSLLASSRVASAAFLLAMKMSDNSYQWSPILTKYSGYNEEDIVPLMKHLNHTMHHVTNKWKQLANVREKYSHEVFFEAALVPFLPDSYANCRMIPPLPQMSFP